MTDGTYKTELRRVFLIKDLPEPLTRASSHLQIFDNYIENTRLRLRSIRSPETKQWQYVLEQRFPVDEDDLSIWRVSEIVLSEAEHTAFEIFEGREISRNERADTNEIRKNRYFYNFGGSQLALDIFLGALWGLNTAQIVFETIEEMRAFQTPPLALTEITNNSFYTGANLPGKTFADVQAEFNKSSA